MKDCYLLLNRILKFSMICTKTLCFGTRLAEIYEKEWNDRIGRLEHWIANIFNRYNRFSCSCVQKMFISGIIYFKHCERPSAESILAPRFKPKVKTIPLHKRVWPENAEESSPSLHSSPFLNRGDLCGMIPSTTVLVDPVSLRFRFRYFSQIQIWTPVIVKSWVSTIKYQDENNNR